MPPPTPLPAPEAWSCSVIEADGTSHGAIRAYPVTLGWELNGIGNHSLYMAGLDSTAALLFSGGEFVDGREVAVHYGTDFVTTCVPSPRQSAGGDTVGPVLSLNGFGFGYHLKRRFIGRLNAHPNLVTVNPDFPTDLAGWSAYGGATVAWSSATGPDGTSGVASVGVSGITNSVGLQQQSIPVGGMPFDTFLWITVWVNVNTGVADYMVPPNGAALRIELRTAAGGGGTFLWEQLANPDWRIKGAWQQVRMKVYVPGGLGSVYLVVQLQAPEGGALYDKVIVRQEERLYTSGDPGTIITALVTHAQDTGIAKTDLFIGMNVVDGGGTNLTRAYKYSGRQNILAAMGEMNDIDGGVDWLPETPALNTREIAVYSPLGYEPPGGRLAATFDTAANAGNVSHYEWVWATDSHADRVIVMGRGDGFELDEGVWFDQLSPDLGWESVFPAKIEGFHDVDQQANGRGRQMRRAHVLRLTVQRTAEFDPAEEVIGDGALLPGRLIDVDVVDGQVNVQEGMKIIKTDLTCETHQAVIDCVMVSELDAS